MYAGAPVEQASASHTEVAGVDDKTTAPGAATSPTSCSCVRTAREFTSMPIPLQDADAFEQNTTPAVGVLALMEYKYATTTVAHVAVVLALTPVGIDIVEGNYEECEITYRTIPYDYKNLKGFWRQ